MWPPGTRVSRLVVATEPGSQQPSLPQTVGDVLESMTDAFVALDRDWRYVYVNRRAGEMFGRDPRDLVGRHIWTEFPEGVGQPFHLAYELAMREQQPATFEEHYEPYGRWFENRLHPSPEGLTIFFSDVTERKLAEQELSRRAERYRVLAEAISTVVWRADRDGQPIAADRWQELTGQPVVDGNSWQSSVHPDDVGAVKAAWDTALTDGSVLDCTYRIRDAADGWRHVHVRGVPVVEDGAPLEWIGVVLDISERVDAEQALRRAALEDALTGLPNRAHLMQSLSTVLAHRDPKAAVIFVDIDRFKSVNDGFGHESGDLLLQTVARRLQAAVRPSDVVSRLSGDEFAVLCDGLSGDEEGVLIARRLCRQIAQPLDGDDRISVSASVGVAFATGDQAAGPEALISAADAAMYRAKSRGGGLVDVFDEDLRRRVFERAEIEREVRAGLDGGAIGLAFQPIVGLDPAGPPAAEALLRWQRPDGPALSAADVVSVAEQVGLIPEIGARVLSAACRTARQWLDAGAPVRVSVNVSARQLVRPDELVGHVRQALAESGLPPALLALEMTESVLMEDMRDGEEVLQTLRALGVEIEIDHFGVGYSSLSYLHRLPIDSIKIDRSFIDGLPEDHGSARVLEAIVGLARAFGIHTTAEGVETREQLDAVRAAGCDSAQGYLLARPGPADELPSALARGRGAADTRKESAQAVSPS